ncbi:MAG: phospholipase D-like domain-containing protein [Mangrovibacterium sp.]
MYYNEANCDIYIGSGAGKKLLKDINSAKESVKIISPYLSPSLIASLIQLHEQNIAVELITTNEIEDYYGDYEQRNGHQLIIQERKTDHEAETKRKEWTKVATNLTYADIILVGILMTTSVFVNDIRLLLGVIPILAITVAVLYLKKKVKRTRIYSYYYSKLFPFKILYSSDKDNSNNTFVHSKIYLIDDQIAYLGSLNFTLSGTKNNHETRVRTTDSNAIWEIKTEFRRLMNDLNLPQRSIQNWGRKLYDEPIN